MCGCIHVYSGVHRKRAIMHMFDNISGVVYNGIMPITFLDSASISDRVYSMDL